MKFYNFFFLLTKWKGKKGLMRDKVKIEKVEMKVIKWEPEMTIEKKKMKREREREREREISFKPNLIFTHDQSN